MNDVVKNLAGRYICFTLGGDRFSIPLLDVKEVIGNIDITPVPKTPEHYKGIMNLRGQVIPVIDLRIKLNTREVATKEMTIIILDLNPYNVGVIVDSIDYVSSYEATDISPAKDIELNVSSDFISGISKKDKSMTLILNLKRVLDLEDYSTHDEKHFEAA